MKEIGIFYGTNTAKTAQVAKKIKETFGKDKISPVSVEEAWKEDFETYDNIIIGAATWFDGELPTYWDELIPLIESMDLKGKKIAIFGLGDQKKYSDNFADGNGILAEIFEKSGATIVGLTSTDGYTFEKSRAIRDGKFLGLVLDLENQSDKTKDRVEKWVKQLEKEFN